MTHTPPHHATRTPRDTRTGPATVEQESPHAGRTWRRLAVLAASAVAALALAAPQAHAANQYTVTGGTPKPEACNNHGTIPGGGWVANGPCGYVMGTAVAGSRFDVNDTSDSGFHYGRTRSGSGNFCAWLTPSSLDLSTQTPVADSCGDDTREALRHRRTFGADFDAAPHTGNGAVIIPLDASACPGYYNYFDDSTYATGTLRDPVGFTLPASGGYRYSSKDRQASMIRVNTADNTIWLWVPRSCIESQLAGHTLNNEND